MRYRFVSFLLFLFLSVPAQNALAADLTAEQAKDHIGQSATVCGTVASTHYAANSRGNPTFINLDKPYPNQVFTIVVWGSDLPKFLSKPSTWEGKRLCATGMITSFRGSPEIVVKLPGQIAVK